MHSQAHTGSTLHRYSSKLNRCSGVQLCIAKKQYCQEPLWHLSFLSWWTICLIRASDHGSKNRSIADCASGLTNCSAWLLCGRWLKTWLLVLPQCVFGMQNEDSGAFELWFGPETSLSSVTDGGKQRVLRRDIQIWSWRTWKRFLAWAREIESL